MIIGSRCRKNVGTLSRLLVLHVFLNNTSCDIALSIDLHYLI